MDRPAFAAVLDGIHAKNPIALLLHGGAEGLDQVAVLWAASNGVEARCYPSKWQADGPHAGEIRNALVLSDGKPDLVVAFKGWRLTADLVRRAEEAKIPVLRVGHESRGSLVVTTVNREAF